MLVIAVSDLWTKHSIFEKYFPQGPFDANEPVWWIEGIFGIQPATNPGALFGLGSGYGWLFAGLSLVIFGFILAWSFWLGGARDRWLAFAFGLISGGIIGNCYDRLGWGYVEGRPGEIRYNVRDWILFQLEGVPYFDPWPNFNIADVGLVIGAVMLLLHTFFSSPPSEQSVPEGASDQ